MREILFKAKRLNNGEWIKGYYLNHENKVYICPYICFASYSGDNVIRFGNWYEVDPETVCQYTGLKDKNDKKIWENDIVRFEGYGYMPEVEIGEVVFSRGCFGVEYLSKLCKALGHNDKSFYRIGKTSKWRDMGASGIITYTYEVLGNIFDNPELLEVTE